MARDSTWSETELKAAVVAYLNMLALERDGAPYNKSSINSELRAGPLSKRSKGSVEYRMQNISAALHELGLPWIEGYKPAANLGDRVKQQIWGILTRKGFDVSGMAEPTANLDQLEDRTKALRRRFGKKITEGKPAGQKSPRAVDVTSKQYVRDPRVRAWILEASNGRCEACNSPAPFQGMDGTPFLEVHHVTPLAEGGADVIENAIAACPNCHRRLHHAADKLDYRGQVIKKVERLIASPLPGK